MSAALSSSRTIAIISFPGSNCDFDCHSVLKRKFGVDAKWVWHQEADLGKVDAVIIPGGFSYGDYLRAGALASHSPVMEAVIKFANQGGYVLGICNGFQALTECGLLPGALLGNITKKFICKSVSLKAETDFGSSIRAGDRLKIPIAHAQGRYYTDESSLTKLDARGQVLFRYCSESDEISDQFNPNGSVSSIAGVTSENGRVLGMMPHPERASDALTFESEDGMKVLTSFVEGVR